MYSWKRALTAAAFAIIALSTSLDAQTIRGVVVDSASAEPIRGVELVVINVDGDTVATPRANSEGRFSFEGPPGTYTFKCRCLGHRPVELTLEVDGETPVTIRMAAVTLPPSNSN